ncbi:LANO_0F11298g1_1 [Lachancea nothofagi CBS 11611]|uniref:LANO_0F11298g1_1 n=1 Tax=Lachancea nothofagi CBS 11611 TaxID=1266666 RepID=A0A1G4KAT9_9SACH|nr:LANO_0F11298g1_1 [Lachancea nothofagi CBS 11611]
MDQLKGRGFFIVIDSDSSDVMMSASPETTSDSSEGKENRKRASPNTNEPCSAVNNKRKSIKSEESASPAAAAEKTADNVASLASDSGPQNKPSASEDKSSINENKAAATGPTGHRPVTSCTHCRQHKIKCNASDNFPAPCSRCERMGLACEIDPQFRPKKGSQLQSLRSDVDELKLKIECLTYNESLIARALAKTEWGQELLRSVKLDVQPQRPNKPKGYGERSQAKVTVQTYLTSEPHLIHGESSKTSESSSSAAGELHNTTSPLKKSSSLLNDETLPRVLRIALKRHSLKYATSQESSLRARSPSLTPDNIGSFDALGRKEHVVATTNAIQLLPSPQASIDEFILGDVKISISTANELHRVFVASFLPYFPIMYSNSATELYSQSQLLFWTVMLTACLSDPEPTLYNQLASLIKQLAIETCWIRTPRSTHISQALLILCNWPLPNQKVLDDCSYRFVGLAKSLSLQLGLHRGKFMSEFTRTQTSMPNAEKWRTRTWLGIFFAEQCWASILGLPPTSQNDYLIELARLREDESAVPSRFRQLICLANFQVKLCEMMGSSVTSPDGLLTASERAGALDILEKELKRLQSKFKFEQDTVVQMYYLYVRLMICCFAFLPDTPAGDQSKYVDEAYLCATKVVTLFTKLLEKTKLIQLPIYVRQSVTYSALILFKLQLTPFLPEKYIDSARQSIVTVHRLYRNQLTAWTTSVENDISRTASVLEKLNFVLISQPEIFIESKGIITRMRSHLTATLFYDLVWCIHEARRRQNDPNFAKELAKRSEKESEIESDLPKRKLYPLPFYNQISKEDFETITQTTPGGTTITTLIPTKNAIQQAKELAKSQGDKKGLVRYINGIPISVLDETGSMRLESTNSAEYQESILYPEPLIAANFTSPHSVMKTSATTEDILPKSPSLFAQPMQRSASTPATESLSSGRRMTNISPSLVSGNTNSLFAVNSTGAPSLALNKLAAPELMPPASPLLPSNSYSSLNMFLTVGESVGNNNGGSPAPVQIPPKQSSELNTFFQAQSAGWMEQNSADDDDFLGWFDINMAPEF